MITSDISGAHHYCDEGEALNQGKAWCELVPIFIKWDIEADYILCSTSLGRRWNGQVRSTVFVDVSRFLLLFSNLKVQCMLSSSEPRTPGHSYSYL